MATYTENFNLVKIDLKDSPPKITDLNANWDIIDAKLKDIGEGSETVKSYTVTPDMWLGTEFPYTCKVTHELGKEPTSAPLVDVDFSSYTVLADLEDAETAYSCLYRVTFDSSIMTLYAKELPTASFTLIVKAVI